MLADQVQFVSIWREAIDVNVLTDSMEMHDQLDVMILMNALDCRAEEMHSVATAKAVFNVYVRTVLSEIQ